MNGDNDTMRGQRHLCIADAKVNERFERQSESRWSSVTTGIDAKRFVAGKGTEEWNGDVSMVECSLGERSCVVLSRCSSHIRISAEAKCPTVDQAEKIGHRKCTQ